MRAVSLPNIPFNHLQYTPAQLSDLYIQLQDVFATSGAVATDPTLGRVAAHFGASREEWAQTRVACARAARKLRLIIDLCEDHARDGHLGYALLHGQIEEVVATFRSNIQAAEARNRKKNTAAKRVGLAS